MAPTRMGLWVREVITSLPVARQSCRDSAGHASVRILKVSFMRALGGHHLCVLCGCVGHEFCLCMNFVLTAMSICIKSQCGVRYGPEFMDVVAWPGLSIAARARLGWVCNMAKAELGLKRTCLSCGMRYYDFNRTPIICPGCQTAFDPEQVVRSRRGRAVPKTGGKAEKADALVVSEDVAAPEEDEAETTEDEAASKDSDDDVEFEGDDIDVSNDDSAGLIADDLDEEDEILPGIPADDE